MPVNPVTAGHSNPWLPVAHLHPLMVKVLNAFVQGPLGLIIPSIAKPMRPSSGYGPQGVQCYSTYRAPQ